MNIRSNVNYCAAGQTIGVDLLNRPNLAVTDPVVSFKTAIWFWMTPQSPKQSCHDVITGRWTPSAADRATGRVAGYGRRRYEHHQRRDRVRERSGEPGGGQDRILQEALRCAGSELRRQLGLLLAEAIWVWILGGPTLLCSVVCSVKQ